MPDRFTNSVRFKIGQSWVKTIESWVKTIEVVQVGDASGMWCLVPTDQPSTIKFVLEALNLKTAADEIVPKTIAVLEAQ